MALDERKLFSQKPETRTAKYQCPRCQRTNDYQVRWVRHTKKASPPGGISREDRDKFEKLRDYLLRIDDDVTCVTCSKKFPIPSQHTLMFADQLAGLPDEAELEREIAAASDEPEPEPERKPALPARFTRKSQGWK